MKYLISEDLNPTKIMKTRLALIERIAKKTKVGLVCINAREDMDEIIDNVKIILEQLYKDLGNV